ncbi:unnamed protein product [Pseudo-nitzschia multistriata]|uniref:PH domain-containing protein n=1 Tax=Pseudo-nitzschia multistriata TaxID=183589 RepID=A0A448ZQ97_9STRA|nr:unnamed protein product [Pseudo-nitzschia multistriata]
MATSLLNNLLGSTAGESNQIPSVAAAMTEQERNEVVALLRSSIECVTNGTCDPVLYQAMGALHRYTAACAGLSPPPTQKPAFVLREDCGPRTNENDNPDQEDALAYGWLEELSPASLDSYKRAEKAAWNPVLALLVQREPTDEPCLWITREVVPTERPYETDDETDDEETPRGNENSPDRRGPATELETLHKIPLKRRLKSCRYQNFYGDHRIIIFLKHVLRDQQIVLKCPSAIAAKSWIDCLVQTKKQKLAPGSDDATHDNIELEMIEASLSNLPSVSSTEGDDNDGNHRGRDRGRTRIINVIDSLDEADGDYYLSGDAPAEATGSPARAKKPLAEQLQEAEDRKRAQQLADRNEERKQRMELEAMRLRERQAEETKESERKQALAREQAEREKVAGERREQERVAALERERLQAQQRKLEEERLVAIEKGVEKIVKIETQKLEERKQQEEAPKEPPKPKAPVTAAEKQRLRMEREIAARKRAEADRRRIEIEYEQAKKERAEQRRRDLEEQRKKAREEQRKKDLLKKKKFLESEQRKEAMKASAMKPPPKKASAGIFSAAATSATAVSSGAVATPSNPNKVDAAHPNGKKDEKGNLWFSLGQQMSAFEAADEERKRQEAEKQKREEDKEEKKEEDPEQVRMRIAEEARQRLVQDEAKKIATETEAAKLAAFRQQQELQRKAWASKGGTAPIGSNSPTTNYNQNQSRSHRSLSPNTAPYQHHPQQQPSQSSSPTPPYPASHNASRQPWNQMQNPSYPPQQPQFQHPQQSGVAAGSSLPGYHQPPQHPPSQRPPGSFSNAMPSHPNHPQTQTHSQTHTAQEPTAPRSTHRQSPPPPRPQPTNGESTESTLKRSVLVTWGLQPPAMQVLKPVSQLICSIHTVFPPAFGMAAHEYFRGWKPVAASEVEEPKLKKTVRKIRFFLHPDKLPHDLTEEQQFLCKLLWDVINDAFEEHKKSKEDLDWM